ARDPREDPPLHREAPRHRQRRLSPRAGGGEGSMGFSVTASYIIFGVALLGAFSVASGVYWKNAAALEASQRAVQARAVAESHANVTIGAVSWNAGASVETFT